MITIGAKALCAKELKAFLNEPDSYEFESATIAESSWEHNEYGKAYIVCRVKNVSRPYRSRSWECDRYIQNGPPFVKARLLKN